MKLEAGPIVNNAVQAWEHSSVANHNRFPLAPLPVLPARPFQSSPEVTRTVYARFHGAELLAALL